MTNVSQREQNDVSDAALEDLFCRLKIDEKRRANKMDLEVVLGKLKKLKCFHAHYEFSSRCGCMCGSVFPCDLKQLKADFKDKYKVEVEWWDLLPFCKNLESFETMIMDSSHVGFDAIANNLQNVSHLALEVHEPPADYDWLSFGEKLSNLTSLSLRFARHRKSNYALVQMLKNLNKLKKLVVNSAVFNESWQHLIPFTVEQVTFNSCLDARDLKAKESSLFDFLCQNSASLSSVEWIDHSRQWAIRNLDFSGLTQAKTLKVNSYKFVHLGVFKYCKQASSLQITKCNCDDLAAELHSLPNLKSFSCPKFLGTEEKIKILCPNLEMIDCKVFEEKNPPLPKSLM